MIFWNLVLVWHLFVFFFPSLPKFLWSFLWPQYSEISQWCTCVNSNFIHCSKDSVGLFDMEIWGFLLLLLFVFLWGFFLLIFSLTFISGILVFGFWTSWIGLLIFLFIFLFTLFWDIFWLYLLALLLSLLLLKIVFLRIFIF